MPIAVLGPSRFGLGEPYCGGLESDTATLARGLHDLGHHVVVFAGPRDAAQQLPIEVVPIIDRPLPATTTARLDTSTPAWFACHETHGYHDALDRVAAEFDVVHDNSLHASVVDAELPRASPGGARAALPAFQSARTRPPATPPATNQTLRRSSLEQPCVGEGQGPDAHSSQWGRRRHLASRVRDDTCCIDAALCVGGSGRIVAETSPHLAIEAANSLGWQLVLAGPGLLRPRGRPTTHRRHHLARPAGRSAAPPVVANSNVAVLTPMWEEPFGLVPAEMLSCGLPLAALDRGAIGEFTDPSVPC